MSFAKKAEKNAETRTARGSHSPARPPEGLSRLCPAGGSCPGPDRLRKDSPWLGPTHALRGCCPQVTPEVVYSKVEWQPWPQATWGWEQGVVPGHEEERPTPFLGLARESELEFV